MELNDKVTQLEDEIKILKNEVQAVLLDLRESFLNNINPFNPDALYSQEASQSLTGVSNTQPQREPIANVLIEEPVVKPIENKPEIIDNSGEESITDSATEYESIDDLPDLEEIMNEQTLGFISDSQNNVKNEVTQKEGKMVWHPETRSIAQLKARDAETTVTPDEDKIDLDRIEELAQWVESSVKKMGHERTRTILDISETMGYVNTTLKNILVKFIHPLADGETVNVTTQDYLSTLVQLNKVLKNETKMEIASLYILILCQEYDNR